MHMPVKQSFTSSRWKILELHPSLYSRSRILRKRLLASIARYKQIWIQFLNINDCDILSELLREADGDLRSASVYRRESKHVRAL